MAQTYVTTHTGAAAQSGLTATVSVVSATAGNHLRLNTRVSSDTRSIVSVSGGAGNTWTSSGERPTDALSNNSQELWYCENCAAGSYTVTITWDSSAASNVECFIDEFSGTATSSSLDVHTSNGAAIGASPLSVGPSSATTNANDNVYTTAMSINGANARPLTTPASYTTDHAGAVNAKATQFVSAHLNVTSTGTQTVSWAWTGGNSAVTGILAAFKDAAGGGPVSKTDTESATLSEQTPAIKLATPTDTATLTEQVPQISPTAQTDSLTFAETQTVTMSSAVSKTDTDTATLTETTNPPVIGVTDSLTLNDSAVTLVVTDVQQVPDFTVTEQTPQIGLSLTDSLTFSETEKLTASFIRFVDSDTFGMADATTPTASISQRDTASLTETQAGTTYILDGDTLGAAESAVITALLSSLDSGTLADGQTVTIIGGFTGYAKGLLIVQDRLAGTLSGTARLAGTLGAEDRLRGITTVAPVGPP